MKPKSLRRLRAPARRSQSGVMLLEALVGILVFSLGLLALVAMQARAIQLNVDARYRADAAYLANQLIGQMWIADKTNATLKGAFETGGAQYNIWKASVDATLPGTQLAGNPPTVTIDAQNVVSVTINWRAPYEQRNHIYVATAQVVE